MRLSHGVIALTLVSVPVGLGGCAMGTTGSSCTVTPYVLPSTVTLDHTATGAGNSVQFTAGNTYTGKCAIPASIVNYQWNLSDPIDATITEPGSNGMVSGTASCKNAALTPITVTPSPTVGATATLICK